MKKFYFMAFIASAALTMTSCSNDELASTGTGASEQTAINFSTYLGRAAETRAKVTDTEVLKNGFGVFAYYTKTINFSGESETPNFMFNQKVTGATSGESTTWTYDPVKYWPNQANEMVSFFAYAPYSENAEDANLTFAQVSGKDKMTGTPKITVKVPTDLSKTTDFVAASVVDQKKPTEANKNVDFKLLHEMTRLSLSAKLNPDVTIAGGSTYADNDNHNKTFVVIKEIKFDNGDNTIYSEGVYTFNKANSGTENGATVRGTWSDLKASGNALDFAALLNASSVKVENAKADIEDGKYKTGVNGVKLTKTSKFESLLKTNEYAFLIPVESAKLSESNKVTIKYDIVTEDASLECGYSCTPVVKTVSLPTSNFLEQGKAYDLQITIGLTEVKLSAEALDWVAADNSINI